MPFEPYYSELVNYPGAVTLPAYANILGISECGLWGVNPPSINDRTQCRTVWTKRERDDLAYYLMEAEQEIERELKFFVQPKWVVGTTAERDDGDPKFIEQKRYSRAGHQKTRWANLIAGGIKAESDISLAKTPASKNVDPMVFTVAGVAVTDIDEVFVYHPGTDVQIVPSLVQISTGTLTIEIPRCRLVTETASDNPPDGIGYNTLSNFEDSVDIKRVYNDPSTNATIVWPHRCTQDCCTTGGCSERTQTACIYIRNNRLGIVDIQPADYSGGSWSKSVTECCAGASLVRLYYQSGLRRITREAQQAIIRLAHTKMSKEPCDCSITGKAWREDNEIPNVLTTERVNCRFGTKEGAWLAFQWCQAQKIQRGGNSF